MENKNGAAAMREMLSKCDAASASKADGAKRLSARQRITSLFDDGTFVEIGAYVTRAAGTDEKEYEGVICGYGAIEQRLVFAFAQDFYRMKGAIDKKHAEKICALYELAIKSGAPVIGIFDSAGAAVLDGVDAMSAYGKIMKSVSGASGIIPQIALVSGVCAGTMAACASMFDILLSVKSVSSLYVNPSYSEKASDLANTLDGGLVTKEFEDEQSAIDGVRKLLYFLPQNNIEGTVSVETADDINRSVDISAVADGNYDVKEIVSAISDYGDCFELSGNYAGEIVCAFSIIGGTGVGVCASQPSVNGGKLTPDGARKAARFISVCDSFNIPLLTLVDSAGLDAADKNDNATYACQLGKLALAYSSSKNAKISVILGNAFGASFTLLGSKSIGADIFFALETAKICAMPPAAAVAFLWNEKVAESPREQLEEKWAAEFASPCAAAESGEIDDVILPEELRARIISALMMLASKCDGVPARRHANLPL